VNSGDVRITCLEANFGLESIQFHSLFYRANRPYTQTTAERGPTKNRAHYDYSRTAIWRWRHKSTWTLHETAFTAFFLPVVSWVIRNLSLSSSTFV